MEAKNDVCWKSDDSDIECSPRHRVNVPITILLIVKVSHITFIDRKVKHNRKYGNYVRELIRNSLLLIGIVPGFEFPGMIQT